MWVNRLITGQYLGFFVSYEGAVNIHGQFDTIILTCYTNLNYKVMSVDSNEVKLQLENMYR